MGNSQTNLHTLYTKVGEVNGKNIVKAGGRLYHLRTNNYPDQESSIRQLIKLKEAKQLINDHLIQLCHFEAETDSGFCSNFYKICLLFQYLPHTLASEISARKQEQNRFSDKQLWSILCSCTLAFSYLQQNGVEIECFNLKDIQLSDDGVIKLNNPLNKGDTCSSSIFDPSYFYSPEQLEGGEYSKTVSGVYQLGLTLLTCINLNSEEQLYTKSGYVDTVWVSNKLKSALKVVNRDIGGMLEIMLNQNQGERPDWIEFEKIILNTLNNPVKESPKPVVMPPKAPQSVPKQRTAEVYQNLGMVCQPMPADTSNESSLFCYESEADEEKMDENNDDMMETNRFQEQTVLKESRRHVANAGYQNCQDDSFKPTKTNKVEVVNEEFQGGKYEGQKVNGYREGYGTFHYAQGGIYTGNWHLNQMQGQGSLYYPSGKLAYEGQWKSDKLDGFGVLYNQDVVKLRQSFDYRTFENVGDCWVKYQGLFKNDNKQGKGKLVLSNGEWFVGTFSEDRVNGDGEFFRKDGTKLVGRWSMNKLVK